PDALPQLLDLFHELLTRHPAEVLVHGGSPRLVILRPAASRSTSRLANAPGWTAIRSNPSFSRTRTEAALISSTSATISTPPGGVRARALDSRALSVAYLCRERHPARRRPRLRDRRPRHFRGESSTALSGLGAVPGSGQLHDGGG